jgi:hypothetical protein
MLLSGADERLSIPFGVSFVGWKSMVVHLLQSGAQSSPVSAKQVAKAAGMAELTVGSNVPFLKAAGIATQDSTRSRISLSRAGAEYARAIVDNDTELQQRVLAECARRAFRPVTRFCELRGDLDFDKVFLQVKYLAGVSDAWGQHMDTSALQRIGIVTAIEIMVFAGLIDQEYLPKGRA